jgi:prepilin-type N-terminal cleavage/methylation domain-containing protein
MKRKSWFRMKQTETERGFSLVEVTIGILILAILGVTFMQAVSTAIMTRNKADVRTTAQSLAESQIEQIKSGPYFVTQSTEGNMGNYTDTISTLPHGYRFATLDTSNNIVTDHIYGLPWDVTTDTLWVTTSDPGIQKLTIIVQSSVDVTSKGVYKEIFRLIDFKVNR